MMRASTTKSDSVCSSDSCGPLPLGWVRAAQELPAARRTFDEIVARAEADLAFRNALVADLEQALAAEGYEPDRRILDEIRDRLSDN